MARIHVSRLAVTAVIIALILSTVMMAVAAQAQEKNKHTIALRIPAMVGLVADNRCNL